MAASFIPAGLQQIWKVWNIRGFMILSLSTQLVLTFIAPLRQKTSNFVLISIVWSAYFLADWTAVFAFGLISSAGCSKFAGYMEAAGDFLAFWASFLLIHLGAPDTITAFPLEDNALWLRHLVGLIAQVFSFLYIFVKTLPDNKLVAPVLLVFAAGIIKYGERTRVLYLASLENFKKSLIKSLNKGGGIKLGSGGPEKVTPTSEDRAVHLFGIFMGLIVDIMPNHTHSGSRAESFF
ncbi:hypothetical protein MLD38_021161 [Melastoma candidum]|uniref:Uncharacterized protein n=1 Tax=Melastoma candidum TaxID=119954 RepID=A0ACB9QEH2_9MYRT|nr:hypothetical protein MLD38_021161 [Melastoma candidum]